MDVRKKLVELLRNKPRVKPPEGVICGTEVYSIDATVDYLIAHGVTVQEWISVKDRLPSKDGCYLVAVTDDHDRRYFKTTWFSCNGGSWFPKQNVTHWMPLSKLPQPPKGE